MKNLFFKWLLLIAFLVISSVNLLAQVNWTKYPGNPVITSGPSGSWYRGLFGSYVLYNTDSLRYEMWFVGSPTVGGDRPCNLGFATSSDGLSWYIHPNPFLTPSAGEWDSYSVEMPIVIRENGLYKMWYYGMASWPWMRIGYATSTDGINWTKYAGNPVLGVGTLSWEAGGVGTGSVIPYEGGYKMWYYGGTLNGLYGPLKMGYATSIDGISWQKDTLHNPILVPGSPGSWDSHWVCDPRVLLIDGMYYMWYTGTTGVMTNFQVGLATSFDGITDWIKHPANPVLRPSQSGWDSGGIEVGNPIWIGDTLLIGDTLYLWYPGSTPIPYIYQVGLSTSNFTPVLVEEEITQPTEYILSQNYPNPFNPNTKISWQSPVGSWQTLKVYDMLGREIATLVDEYRPAGNYEVEFDATAFSSGVYFYKIQAGEFISVRKMVLQK